LFLGVVLIVAAIGFVAGLIPYLGFLTMFLLNPHLTAGQSYVGIKGFRGQRPKFEDLFAGFSRYGTVLGAFLLLWLMYMASSIPAIVAVVVAVSVGAMGGETILIGAIGVLITVPIVIYLSLRFFFLLPLAVDRSELGVMECLRECSRVTQEQRLHLLGFSIVLGLIVSATALLCGIGLLLLGAPLALGSYGAAYGLLTRQLRPQSELQV
jgi:uncharacterized membrane protein